MTTVVAPAPTLENQEGDIVVTNQSSTLWEGGWEGKVAGASWLALLGIGAWNGLFMRVIGRLR